MWSWLFIVETKIIIYCICIKFPFYCITLLNYHYFRFKFLILDKNLLNNFWTKLILLRSEKFKWRDCFIKNINNSNLFLRFWSHDSLRGRHKQFGLSLGLCLFEFLIWWKILRGWEISLTIIRTITSINVFSWCFSRCF